MFKQVLAICAIFAATLVANEKKEEVKTTEPTAAVKADETKKDANVEHKDAKTEEKKDEAKQ